MPIRISDTSGGGRLYIRRSLEGTESTGTSTGGRENSRERLNTDSTILGRLAFHRQSGPSTTDRKVRVFPPSRLHRSFSPLPHFLVAIMLVPRQLTVDRGSIAFHHSRPHGWRSSSFSTPRRAISSCYPDSKSLVLSSRPSPASLPLLPRPVIDIASIESDVEGALSGSSRRPEYPAATSSVPTSPPRETPEMTPMRGSLSNVDIKQSFGSARFSCLQIRNL